MRKKNTRKGWKENKKIKENRRKIKRMGKHHKN